MTTAEIALMHDEVKALARERGAVILAHNYQVPEVQDVADYVGDSLGLSRQAAATDAEAREELWPHHQAMMTRIGAERGWPPITREQFEHAAGPDGALYVGSPETVATKVVNTARLLGLSRFNLKYSAGTLRHSALMKSIELIGTKVAPRVREMMQ